MAIAFRSVSSSAPVSGLTSMATSLPTGTQNGDALILVAWIDNADLPGPVINTPTGWTQIAQGTQTVDDWRIVVLTRPSNGTAPTITWDGTSHTGGWYMLAYSGTDAINPVDVENSILLGDAFDTSAPAGTGSMTAKANGVLPVSLVVNVNGIAMNALAGWTERIDANGFYASESTPQNAGTVIAAPTFTLASSARVNSILLALKPPTPTVVGVSDTTSAGKVTSQAAPAVPAGTAVGDLLVMVVTLESDAVTQATLNAASYSGWTNQGRAVSTETGAQQSTTLLTRKYDGSATPTLTWDVSSFGNIVIASITQVDPSSPVHVVGAWTSNPAGATYTLAAITTSLTNCLGIGICTNDWGQNAQPVNANWTQLYDDLEIAIFYDTIDFAATGVKGPYTGAISSTHTSLSIQLAVEPAQPVVGGVKQLGMLL